MADIEKVIKGLHDARRYLEDKEWFDRCASPHIDVINDAIALLKEQDAKEQISDAIHETAKQFRQTIVRCKDCKDGEPGACGDGVDCDGVWHEEDWFCADGERIKENGEFL